MEHGGLTPDKTFEARYDSRELHLKNRREALRAQLHYNQALTELEWAIGTDLDRAFRRAKSTKPSP